jgi:dihydroorotase
MQYDVLLSGGRVIDPAQGIDGAFDVAIQGGRVAAVQAAIPKDSAQEVFDVSGTLVLPGLIDTHAHVYQYVTGRFGLNADMVGVAQPRVRFPVSLSGRRPRGSRLSDALPT